jgi:hypothetical protein
MRTNMDRFLKPLAASRDYHCFSRLVVTILAQNIGDSEGLLPQHSNVGLSAGSMLWRMREGMSRRSPPSTSSGSSSIRCGFAVLWKLKTSLSLSFVWPPRPRYKELSVAQKCRSCVLTLSTSKFDVSKRTGSLDCMCTDSV